MKFRRRQKNKVIQGWWNSLAPVFEPAILSAADYSRHGKSSSERGSVMI
jgi:hypothetical protein